MPSFGIGSTGRAAGAFSFGKWTWLFMPYVSFTLADTKSRSAQGPKRNLCAQRERVRDHRY